MDLCRHESCEHILDAQRMEYKKQKKTIERNNEPNEQIKIMNEIHDFDREYS